MLLFDIIIVFMISNGIFKGDLDGTILSHAIFCSARCLLQEKNCIQLASYNIVCGCDCRRVLKHVLKSHDIFRVVFVCRKDVVG